MRLCRTHHSFPHDLVAGGSIATIGSYDGLHLGHQKLLDQVLEQSTSRNLPAIVMSFEPTPREFFARDKPPARLMRFREKFEALADYGVDVFFCPRFDDAMKNISAATFIRQILIHAMNVRHLVIGDDFRFARNREGSITTLERAGRALDFSIAETPSIEVNSERVSSTAIRRLLWNGELAEARSLLGRDYRMSGRVVEGARLGRKLGYPTANVNLNRRQSAVMGIFAVRVSGPGWGPLNAVASVGTRPTFAGTKPLLEVHVFDFEKDIYGQYIHVDFVARLRSEQKFDDVQDLITQMHEDAAEAREILAA